jgi:hypothetical protein
MRVFAPKEAMSNPGNHPTLEELAAYIDGMLSKAEAAPVAEHLTECEDCNFVYSETVRFQLEHPSENPVQLPDEEDVVIPFPYERKRPFPWWQSIAAAAVLALSVGGWYYSYFQAPPPPLATAALVAPLPEKSRLTEELWVGETHRGGGGGGAIIAPDASFKFGVQIVNLQVSLEANNENAADDILRRIRGLLEEEVAVDDLIEFYGGLQQSLRDEKPPQELAPTAATKAQEFREWFDTTAFDFGQWTAAGRLAAISREPSFFRERTTRNFVRRFLRQERDVDPEVVAHLRSISEILEKNDLRRSDYEELRQQLESILQVEYPQPGGFNEDLPS